MDSASLSGRPRRITAALLFLTIPIASAIAADALPRQANFEVTFYGIGSGSNNIAVEGDDAVTFYEETLLFTNNAATPLFQNIVAKCISVGYSKGSVNGYCVFTDKDGDKFLETISRAPGARSGKGSLGAGTGKYKGIDGQLDWEPVAFLPADKGSYNFIGKKTGHYRLP